MSKIAPPIKPPATDPAASEMISFSSISSNFLSGCFLFAILKIAQSLSGNFLTVFGFKENPCFLTIAARVNPIPVRELIAAPALTPAGASFFCPANCGFAIYEVCNALNWLNL